jgi:hypothetical protein
MLNYATKLYELGALPVVRTGETERLSFGATSVASAVLGTTIVRLVASADCHVALGAAPIADSTSMLLPANTPEYFACAAGEKVAAIREAADGVLYITRAV